MIKKKEPKDPRMSVFVEIVAATARVDVVGRMLNRNQRGQVLERNDADFCDHDWYPWMDWY